jgi:hypothetical protein
MQTLINDSEAALVPAVFRDRETAAQAIGALQRAGIAADDIGVAVPIREANRIREDSGAETLAGAGRGAAVGAPLGVLGGIALGTFAAGTLGAGGLFLAGAAGMLWGVKVGSLVGVMTRVQRRPNVDRWCELELDSQFALVGVRVRDWAREPEIAEELTRAGAVSVQDQTDLDHTWQELEALHPALSRRTAEN